MKVVDASIVVKLLLEEDDSPETRKFFKNEGKLAAPEIVFVEVANAIATKGIYSREKISEGLDFVYDLALEIHPVGKKLLTKSAILALDYGTAVYDMVYAQLARELKTTLVTADRRFIEKTGFGWLRSL